MEAGKMIKKFAVLCFPFSQCIFWFDPILFTKYITIVIIIGGVIVIIKAY